MQRGAHLADGLRPVVDLVYPPRCPLCGVAVARQGGLCSDCWSDIETPAFGATHEDAAGSRAHSVIAATLYNDASRKLVLTFKHGGKIALAPLLAKMMAARMPEIEGDTPLLVPVPLHRWRLWGRGFNQSALLAKELAKLGKGEAFVDGLVRSKATPSLGGLDRKEREKALTGAIRVRRGASERLRGRDIILVDDVLTSGATSDACVDALIGGGAKTVTIACFARVSQTHHHEET